MTAGWESTTIGDICDLVNGGTPKTEVPDYWGGPHHWITPAEMGKRTTPYIEQTERTLTDQGLRNSSARPLPPYSVILSTRAPIGHLVINTAPMATNQGCKALIPGKRIDHKFLYYYLSSIVQELNDLGTGATFKELSGARLKEVRVPLPSPAEQRRIVAILDEAFEGIATARLNAERNLQNAKDLQESVMRSSLRERSANWTSSTIGSQVTLQRGFDITKDLQRKGSVPVVSSGGVRSYHDTAMVKGPGVVMGRKGTLGKVFYLEEDYWPHDTTLWVKDFKGNDPRFVYRFFEVLDVRHLDSGAANPALNRNLVHTLPVSWPPIEDQVKLVERIDSLSQVAKRLMDTYAHKMIAFEDLRKSLLRQAFSGALTAGMTRDLVDAVA